MDYDVSFQTISWFNGRKVDETLEISPKFQRRAVWLERERSQLLETIMNKLPFPEVYVHTETDAQTGLQKHSVVDGQQRITSILMFLNNDFPLPINDNWKGQHFRDLTDDLKNIFWDYKIVVRFLRQTNDEEIRNLFTKLNTNNVALNDQELRNARYIGKFKQSAERLADIPTFLAIGLFTPRDVRRMLDIEYAGELLVRLVIGITNKKDMLEDCYMEFDEEFPNETEYENQFNIGLTLARSLISPENQVVFKSKGNFYSLFGVCVEYYKATNNLQFGNVSDVRERITDLVVRAKNHEFDIDRPDIEEYSDMSTRSTSDRSRRAARDRILLSIIKEVEGF